MKNRLECGAEKILRNEEYKDSAGGRIMSAHDSEHAHHEPEDESIGVKVGIFFILVLIALYFIASP
jgi:hypothetical protein